MAGLYAFATVVRSVQAEFEIEAPTLEEAQALAKRYVNHAPSAQIPALGCARVVIIPSRNPAKQGVMNMMAPRTCRQLQYTAHVIRS